VRRQELIMNVPNFQQALQQTSQAFAILDAESCIAYANPAFCDLFAYPLHALLGQPSS
jgi:PAS domain-containing protein